MYSGRFETGKWGNGSAPRWRKVGNGLVAKSICKNYSCAAYDQYVSDTIGFTVFDLINDSCHCPECGSRLKPITVSFNNCKWKSEGKRSNGSRESTWFENVGDYPFEYKKDAGDFSKFTSMIFEAQES